VSPERLREAAEEVSTAAAAQAKRVEERLQSIETLLRPLDLRQMSDEDVLAFDAVFFPGGHGPMVDLASDREVARVIQLMHARERTIATVCHGAAALLAAGEGPEGWLFDGFKLAAFTDEEEDQTAYGRLGIPWYVEGALKNKGAVFDDGDAAWVSHVVVDRNLVTGQNPQASEAIADALIKKLGVVKR